MYYNNYIAATDVIYNMYEFQTVLSQVITSTRFTTPNAQIVSHSLTASGSGFLLTVIFGY
jgi:hypothetical protein